MLTGSLGDMSCSLGIEMRQVVAQCVTAAVFCFCLLPGAMAKHSPPLLRAHQVIFSFGITTKRTLEVSQDGRVSLRSSFSRAKRATLSPAELQGLRDFLTAGTIQSLQDSYDNWQWVTDYNSSMEIEMTPSGKTKRIALQGLFFGRTDNSQFPIPIHDLVCRIYGLEQRLGVRYGSTIKIDQEGHKSDDTWCNAESLEVIPKAAP
jgi:hypothetical protein